MSAPRTYGSTARGPSPIPPHIRPSISRNPSSSSSTRQPYHQQREYVPSTLDAGFAAEPARSGLDQRWMYEQAEGSSSDGDNNDNDHGEGDNGDADETDSQADWDAIRERDHASRPRWRRPSPRWLYPFVSGVTLAMGMGVAPRAELYINLACLAHPPQVPNTITMTSTAASPAVVPLCHFGTATLPGTAPGLFSTDIGSVNVTVPASPPSNSDRDDGDISAGDRWFYKLQHEIYEYKRSHRSSSGTGTSSSADGPVPTGPLPHAPDPSGTVPGSTPSPSPSDRPRSPEPGREPDDHDGENTGSEADPPYRQIDPKACKRDPKVQAAAAKLIMTMSVSTGILSALTTGYWGQMSDKLGRTKLMALVEAGLIVNEICFITVATFPYAVPGGYKALLIGPTLEGFLGGISTLTATVNAYISDTTPNGSRASVFARIGGIFMLGFAFGPMLGSVVIQATGNIMTPFYLNVGLHIIYFALILLVLPESLSAEARTILKKNARLVKDARKQRDTLERQWENETPAAEDRADPFLRPDTDAGASSAPASPSKPKWTRRFSIAAHESSTKREKRIRGYVKRLFRKSTAFLQPLEVFMPTQKEEGGRDWNMTATGAALFMMALLFGVFQVKAAYTQYAFGWTSAQLGPYLSFVGFTKGFVMLVVLPLAMKFAKPYFVTPDTMSGGPGDQADTSNITIRPNDAPTEQDALIPASAPNTKVKTARPASLDLWTARISLLLESSVYLILAVGLPEVPFIALTGLATFASGSGPAVNSLALSFMPNSREAGKLFGGVAVLHALGSTLLGPLAFGTLFSTTVGTYAPAVWALAGGVQMVSLIMMCLVRIPQPKVGGSRAAERGQSRPVARK